MMLENEFHISGLISGHLQGTLSEIEARELQVWLESDARNQRFMDSFQDDESLADELNYYFSADRTDLWQRVKNGLNEDHPAIKLKRPGLRVKVLIAAAVATVMVSAGIWFFKQSKVADVNTGTVFANDIGPGDNKAYLILGNGKHIALSDAVNGELAREDGVSINKTADGQLVYQTNGKAADQPEINTIETPRGGNHQVHLPDGSVVWLNSASSLTFSTNLTRHGKRVVKLTGEGYFEIARDKSLPFVVETNRQQVTVLGTHFNINSYPDEPAIRTTLIEGSVRIEGMNKYTVTQVLKPGQQSIVTKSGDISVQTADLEEAVAWKEGYFNFEDEPIQGVMRKLSRWYNIDVHYEGVTSAEKFNGKVSRNTNISHVLNALESTKTIHFKIEGRRVTVIQ